MQKHQEWLDNRSYIQHLQCLKKIKCRKINRQNSDSLTNHKIPRTSPRKNRNIYKQSSNRNNNNLSYEQNIDNSFTDRPLHQNFQITNQCQQIVRNSVKLEKATSNKINLNAHSNRSPKQNFNVSLKQQQLLWDNFLLGKRIIETAPVICKKRHDLQYKKHKQLLSRRYHFSPRNGYNANQQNKADAQKQFRIKKLQEHQQQIYQIEDELRIQQKTLKRKNPNIFSLIIQHVNISKYRTSPNHFQNIMLTMKWGHSSSQAPKTQNLLRKRHVQNSECISFESLTLHQFFFILKKKTYEQNYPIMIQLKHVKSLNILPIGTFSFQFDNNKQHLHKQAKLFSYGKLVGSVMFSVHCGKKQQFKYSNM